MEYQEGKGQSVLKNMPVIGWIYSILSSAQNKNNAAGSNLQGSNLDSKGGWQSYVNKE